MFLWAGLCVPSSDTTTSWGPNVLGLRVWMSCVQGWRRLSTVEEVPAEADWVDMNVLERLLRRKGQGMIVFFHKYATGV